MIVQFLSMYCLILLPANVSGGDAASFWKLFPSHLLKCCVFGRVIHLSLQQDVLNNNMISRFFKVVIVHVAVKDDIVAVILCFVLTLCCHNILEYEIVNLRKDIFV